MFVGLAIILLLVLFLPFTVKTVEENLESFLFLMGLAATIVSQVLNRDLFFTALKDPIHITLAVLIAGLLFRWLQSPIEKGILSLNEHIPTKLFLALIVIILGLISSIITAIITAIILVTVVSILRLDRSSEIKLVVLACFSIGLGATLTPLGEPLSTIATSKLGEDFFYLLKLMGPAVIPGVFIFGLLAALLLRPQQSEKVRKPHEVERYSEIMIRSIKIYLFVMGLTLLGAGFEPFIQRFLLDLSPLVLYWINMVSATLDNATLAAAEISPAMDDATVKAILLGLLISGGMLIPGNIPNIISAGKLNITSSEWARFALPVGLIAMIGYFIYIIFSG